MEKLKPVKGAPRGLGHFWIKRKGRKFPEPEKFYEGRKDINPETIEYHSYIPEMEKLKIEHSPLPFHVISDPERKKIYLRDSNHCLLVKLELQTECEFEAALTDMKLIVAAVNCFDHFRKYLKTVRIDDLYDISGDYSRALDCVKNYEKEDE